MNLIMAKMVAQLLTDYDVKFTRSTDISLENSKRTLLVRNSGARLCLSLHHNAAGDPKARGVEVIYPLNDPEGKRLADLLFKEIVACGIPGRRTFSKESERYPGKDYYFMLRETKPIRTVIIEYGFLSNPDDLKLVTDPAMQEKFADATVRAVKAFIGAPLKKPAPPPVVQPAAQGTSGRVPTSVYFGGKALPCFIENGTTYAPIRPLAELIGMSVDFDGKNVLLKW